MSTETINALIFCAAVIAIGVVSYWPINWLVERNIRKKNEDAASWLKGFRWNEDLAGISCM